MVGVLTGGFSNCDQPKAPDYYGRLSKVCLGAGGKDIALPSTMWGTNSLCWARGQGMPRPGALPQHRLSKQREEGRAATLLQSMDTSSHRASTTLHAEHGT